MTRGQDSGLACVPDAARQQTPLRALAAALSPLAGKYLRVRTVYITAILHGGWRRAKHGNKARQLQTCSAPQRAYLRAAKRAAPVACDADSTETLCLCAYVASNLCMGLISNISSSLIIIMAERPWQIRRGTLLYSLFLFQPSSSHPSCAALTRRTTLPRKRTAHTHYRRSCRYALLPGA